MDIAWIVGEGEGYRTDGYFSPENFQFPLRGKQGYIQKVSPINKTAAVDNLLALIFSSLQLIAYKTFQTFQHSAKRNNVRSM